MAKRKMSTFERLQGGQLNRAQRKEWQRRLNAADPGLEVVHPDAAGIDGGNESHFVAVPAGRRTPNPVQECGSWTTLPMEQALKSLGLRHARKKVREPAARNESFPILMILLSPPSAPISASKSLSTIPRPKIGFVPSIRALPRPLPHNNPARQFPRHLALLNHRDPVHQHE